MKRHLFYVAFVDNSRVVSIHGQNIFKACIFVFRRHVIGRVTNIDGDELILRCILVGKEIEMVCCSIAS